MGNRENLTTVSDLFKLCEKAKDMKLLRNIMSKKVYSCNPMREEDGEVVISNHVYTWINTNRLIGVKGIIGMKPGWTPNASHCLAVYYENEGHNFIVVTV